MSVARDILLSYREGEQALNFFTAERTVALRNVLQSLAEKGASEYELRKIFRWFSITFRTPLADVYDLPLDFVLQHFYESKYEDMESDQREEERQLLSEDEEDRKQRELIEDRGAYEDRVFELEAEEIAKKQDVEEAKKSKEDRGEKLVAPDVPSVVLPTMVPEQANPLAAPKMPPGFTMKFVSDEEMQKLINAADDEDEKLQIDARGNLPKAPDSLPKMK